MQDWIPREGPTNISGLPDGKAGYPEPLSDKAIAEKELEDAKRGVEKVKEDAQRAKNEKLYPKKK